MARRYCFASLLHWAFCSLILGLYPMLGLSRSDQVSFQRLQFKSIHNAYAKLQGITEQLQNQEIRSLELDIYPEKFGRAKLMGDWYIYHDWKSPWTNVDRLSEALLSISQWSQSNIQHEPLVIFIDLKTPFLPTSHSPEQLDELLEQTLGAKIFRPSDLISRCPLAKNLQMAVQMPGCVWPSLAELRGRILIVFTTANNLEYIDYGQTAERRLGFIAPQISQEFEIDQQPYAVFINFDKSTALSSELSLQIYSRSLIARTWDLNDEAAWKAAAQGKIQFLATDKVQSYWHPWAQTKSEDGEIFQILD